MPETAPPPRSQVPVARRGAPHRSATEQCRRHRGRHCTYLFFRQKVPVVGLGGCGTPPLQGAETPENPECIDFVEQKCRMFRFLALKYCSSDDFCNISRVRSRAPYEHILMRPGCGPGGLLSEITPPPCAQAPWRAAARHTVLQRNSAVGTAAGTANTFFFAKRYPWSG